MLSYAFDPSKGETPDSIAKQREIANLLAAKVFSRAPQNVGEGLNAIGQALFARSMGQDADAALKAGQSGANDLFASVSTPQPLSQPAPQPVASPDAAPMGNVTIPVAPASNTTGKIYSNDEPSPLDPPSGQDRDLAIRTIVGEAGNQGQTGMQAVASVIRNRAVNGGYGGNTPSPVVLAKNQFEPWNGGQARARMLALQPTDPAYVAAGHALDAAYAGNDPTSGAVNFIDPKLQIAMGRSMPTWAQGPGQDIGDHRFFGGVPQSNGVQVAQADNGALPVNATPTEGGAIPQVAAALQAAPQPSQPSRLAQLQKVMADPRFAFFNKAQQAAVQSEYQQLLTQQQQASDPLRQLQIQKARSDLTPVGAPTYDDAGNYIQKDALGHVKVLSAADKPPTSVSEYKYYISNFRPTPQQPTPMDYATFSTAKARAGATTISNNVDTGAAPAYDKVLTEGLAKAHAALSNGVEDAQTRARDIAAMQGAIDQIQRNGGTTGGMGQEQILNLKKTINAGMAGLGVTTPFSENDISDKEFLTKFNRSMAGAQAKGAVGSRVTNFEMTNFLKANPGLDMSITGNQRLLGIQAQIEQRNISVGNAIRNATADAVSSGKKINPREVQDIITRYDDTHHIKDPVTGQDLTQSYVLPEFQKPGMGTNAAMAVGHEKNINGIKIKRIN